MRNLVTTLLLVCSISVFAQNTEKASKPKAISPKDKMKMADARHQFLERNYRGALNIYRELLRTYPNNPTLNYRTAECHFKLKRYDLAVDYFQNVKNITENPKNLPLFYFDFGKALQRNGQLDEALEAFEKFKSTAKKKFLKQTDVDKYIEQIKYAQVQMQNPINVKIIHLDKKINSRFPEYSPSITADGKTMIFTSRRSDTKGGGIDKESDFKFFEDVYISEWNEEEQDWEEAYPIEGKLNTEGHDAALSISKDGNIIFLYRNDGSLYIGDIFYSKRSKDGKKWSTPRYIEKPVNTSYFESSASLSADGKYLYFVSERPDKKLGAMGHGDIYVAEKISRNTWGNVKNLGPNINTPGDEISVFIHPDGKTLFFSSDGHKTMGGYDIFMSKKLEDGTWSKPVNLGYPINTIGDDMHFILSTDNKTAYYDTEREDSYGERDIYKIDVSNYSILTAGKDYSLAILKGSIIGNSAEDVEAKIVIKDKETGKVINTVETNEYGFYFITLPAGKTYILEASAPEYESNSAEVSIPKYDDKIATAVKDIILQKKPEPGLVNPD